METRFKGRVSWEELEEKGFQVLAGIHKIVLAWFVVAVRGFLLLGEIWFDGTIR